MILGYKFLIKILSLILGDLFTSKKTLAIKEQTIALRENTAALTGNTTAQNVNNQSQNAGSIAGFISNIQRLTNEQKGLAIANGVQLTSWNSLKIGITATAGAVKAFMVANPVGTILTIGTAIAGLIKAYDTLTVSVEETQEKLEKLMSDFNNALTEANNNAKTIENLADKYEELSKGVDGLGQNVSLTSDEYKEYNSIVNQIAEMFPELISGYTEENNAILTLKGNVEQLRDAYKEAQQEAYNMLVTDGKDEDGNDIIKNFNNQVFGAQTFTNTDYIYGRETIGLQGTVDILKEIQKITNATDFKKYIDSTKELVNFNSDQLQEAFSETGLNDLIYRNFKENPLTDEDLADVKGNVQAVIQSYEAEINSALKDVQSLANAYLNTNIDYESLDSETKNAASILVNSLDTNVASEFENKYDVGEYVNNIVDLLSSDSEFNDALTNLFTLDTSNMSTKEATNLVDDYLDIISGKLGEDKENLKTRLNFDDLFEFDKKIDNEISSSVTYFSNKIKEDLKKIEKDNGITLTIRPQVEASKLEEAGWNEQNLGTGPLYTKTYTDENGTNVVVTPILPDGTILSPIELQNYADKLLAGQTIDADIKLGIFEGDNAQQQAQTFSKKINQLIDQFFNQSTSDIKYQLSNFFDTYVNDQNDLALWEDAKNSADNYIEAIKNTIDQMKALNDVPVKSLSFGETITQLDSYNEALSAISDAYVKFADEDEDTNISFEDFSALNEQLSNVEGIDNYIKAIQEAERNAEETQKAFDDLASAYINQIGIIDDVNEENKDLIETWLEEQGIANANELVQIGLARSKAEAAWASEDLSDATIDEINALAEEAGATGDAADAFGIYVAQKMLAEAMLDVSGDITALSNIVSALGIATDAWTRYYSAKHELESLEAGRKVSDSGQVYYEYETTNRHGETVTRVASQSYYDALTKEAQKQAELYSDDLAEMAAKIQSVDYSGGNVLKTANSGGSKDKDTEKQFDWMEEKIENLNEEIDKLTTKMEDAVGFRPKNTIADSIIAKLQEEADVYTQMIDRYNQELNSIGLSDDYVAKIKEGLIDIETITDETLLNQIKDYQEWDDKLEDCETQLIEVRQRIEEMQYTKLDNVIDQYDILSSSIENCISTQEQLIDLMGQTGEEVTFENYESLISKQEKLAQQYANAYRDLSNEMSQLNLEQGSEEWEKYNSQLEEYKQNVISCTSAVEDYKDEIFELTFKVLDEFNSRIEEVNNTISVMHDLIGSEGLIDENGLSDRGIAQVALYAHELSNAQKQVVEYEEAMDALEEAYDSGLITQEEYNEALSEYRSGQESAVQATKQAQDAILQIVKDGIQAQIDAKQEEIDATKEQLAAEKELNDYREGIVDKSKQIAVLEKQIATLSLSTDRADIAQRLELEEQLADLREELISDQEDHAYDEQVDALDKYLESYTEEKEAEIDELETNLDAQTAAINEYLEKVKDNYSIVYGILNQYGDAYSVSAIEDLTDPWSKGSEAADLCSEAIGNVCSEISYDIAQIDMSPLYELVDLLTQINSFGGYGDGSGGYYEDISGQGEWQRGQGGRWWYGEPYSEDGDYWYADSGIYTIDGKQYSFDDNGYMQTEWVEDDNGNWRYFDANTGEMQKGIWIPGRNGEQYYLDKNGTMATNAAVKGENGQDYYYVDEDGVWDGKTLTYDEVKKLGLKVAYKKGTNNAKKGLALTDEEGLGSEVIITKYGALRQLNSGDHVFNADQVKTLYEMSSLTGLPNMLKDMEKNFANMGKNISYNTTGLTITSPLIQIDGTGMSSSDVANLINSQINDLPTRIMKAIKYNLR